MADANQKPPIDLGIYCRSGKPAKISQTEIIAIALSLIWLVGVSAFFLVTNSSETPPLDSLRFVMTVMAIFLPVALIWVVTAAAKSSRIMREESTRLQSAIDAMRHSYVQAQQNAGSAIKPSVERKLEEIAAAQRKTENAIATFTSIRSETEIPAVAQSALPQTAEPEEQGKLALGTPADALQPPVNIPDFVRALNFPENAEDAEGFRALRPSWDRADCIHWTGRLTSVQTLPDLIRYLPWVVATRFQQSYEDSSL